MLRGTVGWCRLIKERDRQRQKLHFKGNRDRSVKSADFSNISIWISLSRGQREEVWATVWRLYIDYMALLLPDCSCTVLRSVSQPAESWGLLQGDVATHIPHFVALPGVVPGVILLISAWTTLSFPLWGGLVNWWRHFQIVTPALIFLGQVNN